MLPAAEIVEHEKNCLLRPFYCPLREISSCYWEGKQKDIFIHLQNFHSQNVQFTNFIVVKISAEHSTGERNMLINFMACYGEVFKVWFRYEASNQQCYWGVELMESKGMGKNYKYEIGLINQTNKNHTLVQSQVCVDFGTVNLSNACNIPKCVFHEFLFNGEVHYFCKVLKVNK